MDPNLQAAIDYIKHYLGQGVPVEQVRAHFIEHGWTQEHVDWAIQQASVESMPAPQPALHLQIDQPQKYTIRRALKDTFKSWGSNAKMVWLSLVATVVFSILVGLIAGLILLPLAHVMVGSFLSAFQQPGRLFGFLIIAYIVLLVAGSVISSYYVYAFSTSLRDGLYGQRRTFKQTVMPNWPIMLRAFIANLCGSIVTFGPMLGLILLVALLGLVMRSADSFATTFLLFGAVILGMIWALIASLRYTLVQQVAIFEEFHGWQTLGRSKHLLMKGGQWFILKGVALLIVLYIITQLMSKSGNTFVMIIVVLITYAANVIAQGALTMLYCNRVAVRG